MPKSFWIAFGAIVALSPAIDDAAAQRRDQRENAGWERLGCVEVGRRPDRDIIRVGRREGRFQAIRLTVEGNDIRLQDVTVVYGNGRPDELRVREELREGSQTRAIGLKGDNRFIAQIEITSQRDFRGRGRGPATVCVYGEEARARRPKWEDLGCVGVALRKDSDELRVGRREGRFKAIRLRAKGNDIEILSLRVIYGSGRPDEIEVRSKLRQGEETRPLDLVGGDRFIDRIQLRTKQDATGAVKNVLKNVLGGGGGGPIGRADICVEGLSDDRFDRRGRRD